MKSLFTVFTAILALLPGTASLYAQERIALVETAPATKEVVDQRLKLRVPGKVETVFFSNLKQSLTITLRLGDYPIRTPEPQLPAIEVWLLKPDGTVFPHSEKPKRVVSSYNGYAEPILCYAFPNIEKSSPVALVMKVDGEFFVEKLISRETHETNNTVTKISYTNDLSLEMSFPAKVRKGETVKLVVKLTNNRTNVIYYQTDNNIREFHPSIIGSKNTSPAMTDEGTRMLVRKNREFSYSGVGLHSKSTHTNSLIDLNQLFELVPDQYWISVTLEIQDRTNRIQFSVGGEMQVTSASTAESIIPGADRISDIKNLDGRKAWVEIKPATGSDTLSHLIFLIIDSPGSVIQNYRLKANAKNEGNIPLKLSAGLTVGDKQYVVYSVGADEESEIATVIAEWDEKSETFDIMSAADKNVSK